MSDLYIRIESMCQDRGITITKMCAESGASRASLTDLKVGRKKTLSANTLQKIAAYFGCTVDDLLKKEAPTVSGERDSIDQFVKKEDLLQVGRSAFMVKMFEQLPPEAQEEVLAQLLLQVQALKAQDNQ